MSREERVAHYTRGTLIRSEGTFFFRRQWEGEEEFDDYDINVEDLSIIIVDKAAALVRDTESDDLGVIEDAPSELDEIVDTDNPSESGVELFVNMSKEGGSWVVSSPSVFTANLGGPDLDPVAALAAWIRHEVNDPDYEVRVTHKEGDRYGIFVTDRVPLEKFLDSTCFTRRLAKMDIDALVAEKVLGLSPLGIGVKTPKYSSNMSDAMIVIDALCQMDTCCIKLDLDVPGGVWGVRVKGNNYACETMVFVERPAELPMVICLAALKLAEVEV